MRRSRALIPTALLALALGTTPAGAAPAPGAGSPSPAERSSRTQPVSPVFRSQQLVWQPCFPGPGEGLPPGGERLECSTMKAPLDWNDQGRGSIDLAVSRLRPVDGEPKNLLLTNPGGPGEPGVVVPLLFLDPAHRAVADSSEIVGMDVRGTGDSTSVSCGGRTIGRDRDVRDRSRANVDAMLDSAQSMARACQQASAPLGDFVNTAQTVRDFDLLRALLGHERTNWFGFSAGTWLGAHYATAFPARTGRFVLDSSVPFTRTWQHHYALQPMGFERRFRQDFLPWVARYEQVYGLGGSASSVRSGYERVRAFLAGQPLPLEDGTVLTATTLDSLIAGSLYSKGLFPRGAELLAGLNAAIGGPSPEAAGKGLTAGVSALRSAARMPGAPAGAPDAVDATFYTVGCNDTPWYGNRQTLAATSAAQGRLFPLIGWRSIAEPCVFWKRPAVHLPKPTGRGLPPVLMVQSEHDPATPMEGAKLAASEFANARLLRVTDEGDHMLYGNGNACVDEAVNAYLADGVLPRRDATCAGRPLPAPGAPAAATAAPGERHTTERLAGFADRLSR
ncbi:alpha/beta hydrolase [Streptomyces sp. NPDC017448]|uniref:alpha/beta hydrolase n=1 Tax=Streptomyces sp. NPDC017448 TaxID=3364996 RepID=UPI003790F523